MRQTLRPIGDVEHTAQLTLDAQESRRFCVIRQRRVLQPHQATERTLGSQLGILSSMLGSAMSWTTVASKSTPASGMAAVTLAFCR